MIELRKRRIEDAMDQGGDTPALYTVLPEKKTAVGQAMMGSAHIYDLTGVSFFGGRDIVLCGAIFCSFQRECCSANSKTCVELTSLYRQQASGLERHSHRTLVKKNNKCLNFVPVLRL